MSLVKPLLTTKHDLSKFVLFLIMLLDYPDFWILNFQIPGDNSIWSYKRALCLSMFWRARVQGGFPHHSSTWRRSQSAVQHAIGVTWQKKWRSFGKSLLSKCSHANISCGVYCMRLWVQGDQYKEQQEGGLDDSLVKFCSLVPQFKVALWSNSRYPFFFYIFVHNRSFLDILPNFNLLWTLQRTFSGPLFSRI